MAKLSRVRSSLPASAAMSTTTEPGRIASTASRSSRRGAGLPGISAVVMMMSTCGKRGE